MSSLSACCVCVCVCARARANFISIFKVPKVHSVGEPNCKGVARGGGGGSAEPPSLLTVAMNYVHLGS